MSSSSPSADIYSRPRLELKSREIANVAALNGMQAAKRVFAQRDEQGLVP